MMKGDVEIVGRQREIRILESYIGKWIDGGPIVPSVFVYGQAGTGKTLTIRRVLSSLSENIVSAEVNCIETYSPSILFAEILFKLDKVLSWKDGQDECEEEDLDADHTPVLHGHSLNNFVTGLCRRIDRMPTNHSVCLFFDQAERLRDFHAHILDLLTRLHELCDGRVVCIFASRIAWEKFPCGAFAGIEPMVLHFPNYSREELFEVLMAAGGDNVQQYERLYRHYVNVLLDVLGPICRDAGELVYLTRGNFDKFLEPTHDELQPMNISNEMGLWRRFEPHMVHVMQSVFIRHVTDSNDDRMVDLPYFTRYLLLASYLASYNSKSSDKKFFLKNAGLAGRMSSKAKHSAKRADRTKNHMLGPKSFPLDRWMAIFYAIIEDKVPHSVCVVAQVPTLVSLNLVSQAGGEDCLSKPKYKCVISFDIAQEVAKSVGFELLDYLQDFN